MWQLVLIQGVTFILIIIFLRLLFHKHLSFALKRLQELHNQNLEKEAVLNRELERAKLEREAEAEKGRQEAQKLKDAAKEEAEKIKAQALAQSKQGIDKTIQEAKEECERLKRQAIVEIEESGVSLASGIIKEIFSEAARQELQRELIDELIAELRKIDKEKMKVEVKKVEIVSSFPLLDKQKDAIRQILSGAIGSQIELAERVDPAVISGLIINLGGRILDGSLQNKLSKVIPYIKKERDSNSTNHSSK